jgi:hypothetical protein
MMEFIRDVMTTIRGIPGITEEKPMESHRAVNLRAVI